MERALIVSSDGHVGARRMADYRGDLDPGMREDFDDFVAAFDQLTGGDAPLADVTPRILAFSPHHSALLPEILEEHVREVIDSGAVAGEYDPTRRIEWMESIGVVDEVLYPNSLPLSPAGGLVAIGDEPELRAGAEAYNRWLCEFWAHAPDRFAGLALVPFYSSSIDAIVAELQTAAALGCRGVVIPGTENNRPTYVDSTYDPVWATCVELDLPVCVHGASGIPPMTCLATTDPATSLAITSAELSWYAHRPLWFLTLGGVLERHPDLKVVFSEQLSGWVPRTLERLDYQWRATRYRKTPLCARPPSEYFARQCYLSVSIASRAELAIRHEIGIANMMHGVDLPHVETTSYRNRDYLQVLLGGNNVPEHEARMFLSENVAGVYGLDTARLLVHSERVGLPLASFVDLTA